MKQLLLAGLVSCMVSLGSPAAPPPNIIVFLADDMGIGDSSAYQDLTGNPDEKQIHTPNMERLAQRGTRFTDVHSPGSTCTSRRVRASASSGRQRAASPCCSS